MWLFQTGTEKKALQKRAVPPSLNNTSSNCPLEWIIFRCPLTLTLEWFHLASGLVYKFCIPLGYWDNPQRILIVSNQWYLEIHIYILKHNRSTPDSGSLLFCLLVTSFLQVFLHTGKLSAAITPRTFPWLPVTQLFPLTFPHLIFFIALINIWNCSSLLCVFSSRV